MRIRLLSLIVCGFLWSCNGSSPAAETGSAAPGGNSPPPPSGGGGGSPTSGQPVAFVYVSDNDFDDDFELFAANREGRFLNLSHAVADEYDVTRFALSPDETMVAFAIDAGPDTGLYVTPIGADAPVRLSPVTETIEEIAWSPDSAWIAYRASASPPQLYGVRPDGTGHRHLSIGASEVIEPILWSPSGEWIAYRSNRAVAGQFMVHVTRPDGSGETQVSDTLADSTRPRFTQSVWAPTGNCLLCRTDMETVGVSDLYVACAETGWSLVHVSTETGTTGSIPDWLWSHDGLQILYRRIDMATGKRALYIVSKDGSDARLVFIDPSGLIGPYAWSPNNTHFAFKAGNTTVYVGDGTATPKEVAAAGLIHDLLWSPSGVHLAIRLSASASQPRELQCLDITSSLPATRVSEDGDDVLDYAWSLYPEPAFECDEAEVLGYAVEEDCDDDDCFVNPTCDCVGVGGATSIDGTGACAVRWRVRDPDGLGGSLAAGPSLETGQQVADEELTYLWTVGDGGATAMADLGRLADDDGRSLQPCTLGNEFVKDPMGTCVTPKCDFVDTSDPSKNFRTTTCQYYDDSTANACITTMHDIPGFAPQPARKKPCATEERQTAAEDDWPGGFEFVIDPTSGRFLATTYTLDLADSAAQTWVLDLSEEWYLWLPSAFDTVVIRDSEGTGIYTLGYPGYPLGQFAIVGRSADGKLLLTGEGWIRTADVDLSGALTSDGHPVSWLRLEHLPVVD